MENPIKNVARTETLCLNYVNMKQIELLSHLDNFTVEDVRNKRELFYTNRKEFYNISNNTLTNLGEKFKVNGDTMRRWVFGRTDTSSSMSSLVGLGLVKAIKINPSKQNSPYILYKGVTKLFKNQG